MTKIRHDKVIGSGGDVPSIDELMAHDGLIRLVKWTGLILISLLLTLKEQGIVF